MKKLKNKEYQNILAEKRFVHNLKRKNKDTRKAVKRLSKKEIVSRFIKPKEFRAPLECSLITNTKETLEFIESSIEEAKQGTKILHNFDDVKNLTPDVLMYMMSLIEELQVSKKPFHIQGRYNNDYSNLFKESGFIEYLKNKNKEIKDINSNILAIKTGQDTKVDIAQKVVKNLREWLSLDRNFTKPIYRILIECMTNTNNHAYLQDENKLRKWYLMAYYKEDSVQFVFLDNGVGIASTIKKNWYEIISLFHPDEKLIQSALDGEILRSQTGDKKRGKGLPSIKKSAESDYIKELFIISNKAFIDCTNNFNKALNKEFKGTLISWKICNSNLKGNNND